MPVLVVVPDYEDRPDSQNVGSLAIQPLDEAAAGHIVSLFEVR
jgi:hypothetical protein